MPGVLARGMSLSAREPAEVAPPTPRPFYREPLFHFVLLGVLLASGRAFLHPDVAPPIVLSAELDAALSDEHLARHGRAPTEEELDAARARWVRDEALYREARSMGLDEGDAIVRRRLIQKMEFVLAATLPSAVITDEERRAYLDAHRAEFELPERRALVGHFFSSLRADSRADPRGDALAARARLLEGAAIEADPSLSRDGWSNISEAELARATTSDFAAAVFALPEGVWSEPLTGPGGIHLVRVEHVEPAHAPALASVASRIDAAIEEERARTGLEAAAAEVVSHYEVVGP